VLFYSLSYTTYYMYIISYEIHVSLKKIYGTYKFHKYLYKQMFSVQNRRFVLFGRHKNNKSPKLSNEKMYKIRCNHTILCGILPTRDMFQVPQRLVAYFIFFLKTQPFIHAVVPSTNSIFRNIIPCYFVLWVGGIYYIPLLKWYTRYNVHTVMLTHDTASLMDIENGNKSSFRGLN